METVFDVVVNTQVGLDQVREVLDDFALVLVQESLELRHVLELIEVLFEFSIEVDENLVILVQDFKELILGDLVSNAGSLLKLTVLLTKSLIESWDLHLIIVHKGLLLLQDHLIKLVHKVLLATIHCSLALIEYLAHELGQIFKILITLRSSFFNFILKVSKISLEVIQLQYTLVDEVLL